MSKKSYALLALRIAAGVIFIAHGYGKLFGNMPGMEAFTGMVAGIGFPLPQVFAYLAALTEFFGGIALLLGVFTRAASALLAVVMLVALVGVKHFRLPISDPDIALLGIVIALFCMGSGRLTALGCVGGKGGSCCGNGTPPEKK